MEHKCKQIEQSLKNDVGRIVDGNKLIPNHGPAISHIEYVSSMNVWVAHCDEYATVIKYCPFCGEELAVADFYLK
jgi:wobble nucleotide-excising tRNase